MNKNTKLFSVLSYITWIGWFVSLALHDKGDTMVRHHLNQALVLNVAGSVASLLGKWGGIFGVVGGIIGIGAFVFFIIGLVRAAKLSDEPLPIIGDIRILQ